MPRKQKVEEEAYVSTAMLARMCGKSVSCVGKWRLTSNKWNVPENGFRGTQSKVGRWSYPPVDVLVWMLRTGRPIPESLRTMLEPVAAAEAIDKGTLTCPEWLRDALRARGVVMVKAS